MATRIPMTPAALEARRRNALKSTGPRSKEGKRRAAQNARRAGASRLGRSPARAPGLTRESEKLLDGLREAFEPANPAERLLVEELAWLHLRKQRNQEAQEGLIQKNLAKLQRERSEHQRELTLESSDYPCHLAAAAGLFAMEDCPAKFRQLSRLLNTVKDDVELGHFSPEVEKVLESVYGPSPSMRGARVLGSYRRLLASGFAPLPAEPESALTSPGTLPPGTTDTGLDPSESEEARAARLDRASLEATRAELLRALQEEKASLAAKYERYLEEHILAPTALRRAAFVPTKEEWPMLIRQERALDRQIETKMRLLLFMQWVRRSKEQSSAALYRDKNEAGKG